MSAALHVPRTTARPLGRLILVVALCGALGSQLRTSPVGASGGDQTDGGVAMDAGDALIVNAVDRTTEVTEGDSNSVFSVQIPDGSVCPGDSANDDWRVQSFIVPDGTDLATLEYGATRPRGDFMYGLYTLEGAPFVQVLTAQNPGPGQPGLIIQAPPLSFAPFTPDLLPVGRYLIGISCSYYERVAKYWDAEIDITDAPEVQPGQRRWEVVDRAGSQAGSALGAASASSGNSDATRIAAAALAGIAVLIVGAVVWRRTRRAPTFAKEHSR